MLLRLAIFAVISTRMDEQVHYITFHMFAVLQCVYVILITINQHNIKTKCVATFPAAWRYSTKVILIGLGMALTVVMLAWYAAALAKPCWNWLTEDIRR